MRHSLREEQEALFKRQRKETESLTFSTTNRHTNSLFSLVSVQSSRHCLLGSGFLWRRLVHTHISSLRLWTLGIRIWKKKYSKKISPLPCSVKEPMAGRSEWKWPFSRLAIGDDKEWPKVEPNQFLFPWSISACLVGMASAYEGCQPAASTSAWLEPGASPGQSTSSPATNTSLSLKVGRPVLLSPRFPPEWRLKAVIVCVRRCIT